MSVRQSSTLLEVRSALRLGDAIRSAPDTASRKRRLLLGLCDLLKATNGVCVTAHHDRRSRRRTILSVVTAVVDQHRSAIMPVLSPRERQFAADESQDGDLLASGLVPPSDGMDLATDARPDLGRGWKSRTYCRGACVYSVLQVGETGVSASIRICSDHRRCSPRQRAIVNLIHLELGWIYRSDLPLASPEALSLSPRQRDVLEHLLNGDGEKQIAVKLKLSRNTVHHHVKAIHRHFRVSSRSELLARWVGK